MVCFSFLFLSVFHSEERGTRSPESLTCIAFEDFPAFRRFA